MELRTERGRALVVGAPELFEPPAALANALNEWAEVAAAVCANGGLDQATADMVSVRGRRLAARLAAAAGVAVGYHDPVRGTLERVPGAPSATSASSPAAASPPAPGQPADHEPGDADPSVPVEQRPDRAQPDFERAAPDFERAAPGLHSAVPGLDSAVPGLAELEVPGGGVDAPGAVAGPGVGRAGGAGDDGPGADEGAWSGGGAGMPWGTGERHAALPARSLPGAEPPAGAAEPTPWATGLTVSAFVAAVVLAAVGTLVRGLGEVGWWLGGIGLTVVTAGLLPSVWLARRTPLWRWLSYGVAGGLALSWVAGLFATLGP